MEEPLTPSTGTLARVEVVVRPNRSLSAPAILVLVAAVILAPLLIGVGFWLMGAVLVLPFAGLEALLVGGAFWFLYRHQSDHERIVIADDQVEVIRSRGGRESRERFPRYWVRVRTVPGLGGRLPRVMLGSHGRFVELGSALAGPQREALARELVQQLRLPDRRDTA